MLVARPVGKNSLAVDNACGPASGMHCPHWCLQVWSCCMPSFQRTREVTATVRHFGPTGVFRSFVVLEGTIFLEFHCNIPRNDQQIPEFFREVLAWNARFCLRACVYIWCMSTWDSKVTRPALVKLPTRAVEWVASPGELATKGVHAPREAVHEWMLAPVPENQNVLFIFWSTLNLLTRKCWN